MSVNAESPDPASFRVVIELDQQIIQKQQELIAILGAENTRLREGIAELRRLWELRRTLEARPRAGT